MVATSDPRWSAAVDAAPADTLIIDLVRLPGAELRRLGDNYVGVGGDRSCPRPATRRAVGVRPTFSFLTTAYGTEHLIGETIESVLAQTRDDWELVVVDNGNSEAMASVVARYLDDDRIHLVRQENAGTRAGGDGRGFRRPRPVPLRPRQRRPPAARLLSAGGGDDRRRARRRRRVRRRPPVSPRDLTTCPSTTCAPSGCRARIPRGRCGSGTCWEDDPVLHRRYPRGRLGRQVGGYAPGIDGIDESVVIWLRLTRDHDVRLLPDVLARYRIREDSLSRDSAKVEGFEDALERSFRTARRCRTRKTNARCVRTSTAWARSVRSAEHGGRWSRGTPRLHVPPQRGRSPHRPIGARGAAGRRTHRRPGTAPSDAAAKNVVQDRLTAAVERVQGRSGHGADTS